MTYVGLLLIQHLQKLEKIVSNVDLTVENPIIINDLG